MILYRLVSFESQGWVPQLQFPLPNLGHAVQFLYQPGMDYLFRFHPSVIHHKAPSRDT